MRWDAPRARPDRAGTLHRPGRGDRAGRRHRQLGAAGELPPGRPVAAVRRAGRRLQGRRQRVGPPARRRPAARGARRPRRPTGLPGPALTLEMTESVLMERTDEVVELLRRIKTLGVRLAVDDFGTGYSSLSYLSRFPVDILKVDKSFVAAPRAGGRAGRAGAHHRPAGRVAAAGHGRRGHRDRRSSASALEAMGCTFGQGFLFARPMPAAEMDALLAAQAERPPRQPPPLRRLSRRPPACRSPDRAVARRGSRGARASTAVPRRGRWPRQPRRLAGDPADRDPERLLGRSRRLPAGRASPSCWPPAVDAVGGSERPGPGADGRGGGGRDGATASHLLVQAGTGTGKSLAYLVPALLHDGRVVVATATIALQNQVVDRDLPALVDAVEPLLRRRPTYAILKGRSNYLCRNKVHGGMPDDDEDALFDPSPTTQLGPRRGAAARLGRRHRDRRPRRARPRRDRPGLAAGQRHRARVPRRDALPLRRRVLRRAGARAGRRGRRRRHQPRAAGDRRAGGASPCSPSTTSWSSTRRTSWSTG